MICFEHGESILTEDYNFGWLLVSTACGNCSRFKYTTLSKKYFFKLLISELSRFTAAERGKKKATMGLNK